MFVLEGRLADECGAYPAGTWLRLPVGSEQEPRSDGGATLYVKTGGLPGLRDDPNPSAA